MILSQNSYDVLIVGAGPVGSVLALLLAALPLRIGIIDSLKPEERVQRHRDGRTTAISWGSSKILEKAGIWPSLQASLTPINEIRISQSLNPRYLHFDVFDAQGHPMGYIVPNDVLRLTMAQALTKVQNCYFHAPATLRSFQQSDYGLKAILEDGTSLTTKLLVAADGRNSLVRSLLGLRSVDHSYQQTAIVTSVFHEKSHLNWAFEHFLPSGPLAFLPIGSHQSSIVWSVENPMLAALKNLSTEDFIQEIFLRFPYLGSLTSAAARWYYPLDLVWNRHFIGPRSVLIGDAGHTLHPIAGQGANLGFRDAATLAQMIIEQAQVGLDLGESSFLHRYQRRRLIDISSMTAMTDGLVRLFSQNSSSLAWMRGMGMAQLQKIPFVRRHLARHAMGVGF